MSDFVGVVGDYLEMSTLPVEDSELDSAHFDGLWCDIDLSFLFYIRLALPYWLSSGEAFVVLRYWVKTVVDGSRTMR